MERGFGRSTQAQRVRTGLVLGWGTWRGAEGGHRLGQWLLREQFWVGEAWRAVSVAGAVAPQGWGGGHPGKELKWADPTLLHKSPWKSWKRQILTQKVWGTAQDSAFSTNFQVIWGPVQTIL